LNVVKPGRNDPCPCGSGKKYKRCCLSQSETPGLDFFVHKLRQTEGKLVDDLLKHADKYYGERVFAEAWDEFSLWLEVPMNQEEEPELDSPFLPWFLFNWQPDNAEKAEEDQQPELPIAEHYLQHNGDRLGSLERRFIQEACSRHFSFCVVLDLEPGRSLTLRDLFCRQEIMVWEKQASTTLRKGDTLFARTISLDGVSIMFGCAPFVIPASFQPVLLDARDHIEVHHGAFNQQMLAEYDFEIREIYYDIREQILNPRIPGIHNTDGDPMLPTTLHYRLYCSPEEAFTALQSLALPEEDEDLLAEAEYDELGQLRKVHLPWLKRGNRQHTSWNNTLMGDITIEGEQLTVAVNSKERAESIQRKMIRRLGKRVKFQRAVHESLKKALDEHIASPTAASQADQELMASPEIQGELREMAEEHWHKWLDMPLPALNNQTPLKAARTEKGRERLEALMMDFEQRQDASHPFAPDIAALRRSLGLREN
jgi:SEC-C motif/Antitoxin Xre/MbcA/ParS C-terminal toxin-binding domain